MTDAIAVLPPGWRCFSDNGDLVTDAVISFFVAGTLTPKTVYADADLTTPLGVTVNCNSAGAPVTSGNVKTLIYTNDQAYKIRISSAILGGTLFEFDDCIGALDTSSFLTSAAVADVVIVPESSNRTITIGDKGKLISVDCSSGALTMTLNPAATLTSGFSVGIRHNGTANQVKITGNGVNTFALNGVSTLTFSLTGKGQTVFIACDGSNFTVYSQMDALIGGTTGMILVADRLSAPPGSPAPGARYIVGAAPTGAWATFAQGDLAEATGLGTWFKYTPPASAGWRAYVQSLDRYYSFRASAWIDDTALFGVNGLVIKNNATTPTTKIDVTLADAYIGLATGAFTGTIDATTVGANGLDAGALAANTEYHVHLISNGVTTAALLSLSATAPTMPSGYTYRYRIGATKTLGASTFIRGRQAGNRFQFTVVAASTTPNLPIAISGASGSPTVPTWTNVPINNNAAAIVPTTATKVNVMLARGASASGTTIIAPNNAYGAAASTTNPPPLQASGIGVNIQAEFVLESTSIFYADVTGNGLAAIAGWTDAVNAN